MGFPNRAGAIGPVFIDVSNSANAASKHDSRCPAISRDVKQSHDETVDFYVLKRRYRRDLLLCVETRLPPLFSPQLLDVLCKRSMCNKNSMPARIVVSLDLRAMV